MENFAAYAASLGLPVTPKIRFVSHKKNVPKKYMGDIDVKRMKRSSKPEVIEINPQVKSNLIEDDGDDDILYPKEQQTDANMDDGLDDVLYPKVSTADTNNEPEKVTQ